MFAHYYESKQRHCHFSCIGLLCTTQYHENSLPGGASCIVDNEDEHHWLVPGQWRQGVNLQGMEVNAGNRDTHMAKTNTVP